MLSIGWVGVSVISDEACFGLFLLGKGLVCVNLKGAYLSNLVCVNLKGALLERSKALHSISLYQIFHIK